jgi:hypothetical protein
VFLIQITVAGATQFVATTAIATFLEAKTVTTLPSHVVPRIHGYNYNSTGAAHTVNLRLSPAVGSAAQLQIPLEVPTTSVNNFEQICGRDGYIVPRLFGLVNSVGQAPDTALGTPNNAAPFVLLFSTTGKAATGVFRVWYSYVDVGGTL